MNHYLIVCRSVTQAQRAGYLLSAAGITNRIFRSPVGLTERGCSYSVRIGETYFARAMELLRQNSLRPVKVFLHREGQYHEVALS